ncbi:MAG: FUSC family protein [Actinomycetia bacterium]|nr:FUSC family protein [Actinomycetes bacterium]
MREVFALDLSKLSLRTAIIGTIVLGITVVLVGVFGNVAIAAGLAAVFVTAAGPADTRRPDLGSVLLVVVGAAVTFLVSLSASSQVAAAVVITAITLAATLLALLDKRSATMGVFGLLWAVLVLDVGATADTAASMAAAFAIGGVLALLALWIADRFLESDPDPEIATEPEQDMAETAVRSKRQRDVIVRFAIVRALGAGACVLLGYSLFPENPAWAVLTFVLVIQPPAHQFVVTALGRAIGTAVGVVLGVLIIQVSTGNTVALLVAFVASSFLMMATRKVNYAVSTLFTTGVLLISQALLQEQASVAAWQRLLATLLGVVIAFAVVAVLALLTGHHRQAEAEIIDRDSSS